MARVRPVVSRYASPLATRAVLSPNYTSGRYPAAQFITLHTVVGSLDSALSAFQSSARQASSSYVVGLDGEIVLVVPEWHSPWTNTTWLEPGGNGTAVTIEHEDDGNPNDSVRTPAQYGASALLVRDIAIENGIPLDRWHVRRHQESDGGISTACCDGLDADRIVRMAAGTEPLPGEAGGVKRMTRDDWAAIYRALFTLLLRIPGAVPADAAKRFENQLFAEDALAGNPDLVMLDFLGNVMSQRPDLTVPLLPVVKLVQAEPTTTTGITETRVKQLAVLAVKEAFAKAGL